MPNDDLDEDLRNSLFKESLLQIQETAENIPAFKKQVFNDVIEKFIDVLRTTT